MRAAVLVKPGEITWLESSAPPPRPGEVQVAVNYVAICGSDLAHFEGRLQVDKPVVFGHEFSGQVSAIRPGISGFEIGQPVTVAPLLSCGACRLCLAGKEHLCPERRIFGVQVDGALQEFVCMPASRIFPLPGHVSLPEGALVEPLAVAVHALHQAGEVQGSQVAVLGGGAIGLLIAQVARAWGAQSIIVVDIEPGRLDLAGRLGLTTVNSRLSDPVGAVLANSDERGVDIIFEATGSPEVARYFLPVLAPRGVIVIVGRMEQPVPLDLDAMLFKEARLVTSRYFTLSDFQQALNLLATGPVRVAPLIQKVVPFERMAERQGAAVMGAAQQVMRLLIELRRD